MSRCKACDAILSEEEMRMKDENGDYYDTCMHCRALYFDAVYGIEHETNDFFSEGRRGVVRYD